MKRFIALCALTVAPFALKADAQSVDAKGMTSSSGSSSCTDWVCTPTAADKETWNDRTRLIGVFNKSNRAIWDIATIQPLYRTEGSMANTVFLQADYGAKRWDQGMFTIGVGYRHLAACNNYMIGVNLFFDHRWNHHHHSHKHHHGSNGLGAGLEWFGRYFTVRLDHGSVRKSGHTHNLQNFWGHHRQTTDLILNFQLPYLPWTVASFGPRWNSGHHHHHDHNWKTFSKHNWFYGLKMNLAGPVALETGFDKGWGQGGFVALVLNLGRASCTEHTLSDGDVFGAQAFTARDLKNYTLQPIENYFDSMFWQRNH